MTELGGLSESGPENMEGLEEGAEPGVEELVGVAGACMAI